MAVSSQEALLGVKGASRISEEQLLLRRAAATDQPTSRHLPPAPGPPSNHQLTGRGLRLHQPIPLLLAHPPPHPPPHPHPYTHTSTTAAYWKMPWASTRPYRSFSLSRLHVSCTEPVTTCGLRGSCEKVAPMIRAEQQTRGEGLAPPVHASNRPPPPPACAQQRQPATAPALPGRCRMQQNRSAHKAGRH